MAFSLFSSTKWKSFWSVDDLEKIMLQKCHRMLRATESFNIHIRTNVQPVQKSFLFPQFWRQYAQLWNGSPLCLRCHCEWILNSFKFLIQDIFPFDETKRFFPIVFIFGSFIKENRKFKGKLSEARPCS